MKRNILFIIYIIISILLVGCEFKQSTDDSTFKIIDTSLSAEDKGFKVAVDIDFDSLTISENDITSYGIVIVKSDVESFTDITLDDYDISLETMEIEDNKVIFTVLDLDTTDYTIKHNIRAFIKYQSNDQEEILYANAYQEVIPYNLAKEDDSEYAKEIILEVEKKISNVEVTIDLESFTATTLSSYYQVSLNKEDSNVVLTVTLNEGFLFDEVLTLIVNEEEVANSDFTTSSNSLTYIFEDPNYLDPEDYVPVTVTFDPNGGNWSKEVFSKLTPDNIFTATSLNDFSGKTYSILDKTATTYRYFHKLFIKYDSSLEAYKVVAVNSGTANIVGLDLPDYDYVLSAHGSCLDTSTYLKIKDYASTEDTIGMYVIFEFDVNEYKSGDITTLFYSESTLSGHLEEELYEAEELPVPLRKEYNFLGWSDGENTYTVFPRYKAKEGVSSVTYTAVYESLSSTDFRNYMLENIPNKIEGDLMLPTSFSKYSISWSSNNPSVISSDGVFKKPYQATVVSLTATLTSGTEKEILKFEINVDGYKTLGTGIASSYIYRNYSSVTDEFFDTLDVINAAFITANEYGTLSGNAFLSSVKTYIMPKAHAKGDWVVMSIAPESSWSAIASDPSIVQKFADNIVRVINEYGFDGVDIDWETPTSAEKTYFTSMMAVIYSKVKSNNPNHLVTAAITGGMWQPPRYDLTNSAQYLDYINLMTYGMVSNGGYYQNALYQSGSNDNPTFGVGKTLNSCTIDESIIFLKNTYNIPYSKIVVGLAFYGMKQTRTYNASTSSWSGWSSTGSVYYHSIVNNYLNNSNYTEHYDEISEVPYIVKNDGTEFISYDNPRSVIAKSEYILSKGLGGAMFWEYGTDNTGDLLAAMKTGLNK